jgi:hypothetical protein
MGGAFSTRVYDDKFIQDCSRKGNMYLLNQDIEEWKVVIRILKEKTSS